MVHHTCGYDSNPEPGILRNAMPRTKIGSGLGLFFSYLGYFPIDLF
jgi:hypothetical protein